MSKETTAMQTLINKIEQLQSLDAVINPLGIVKQFATDLLLKEQKGIEEGYINGRFDGGGEDPLYASATDYFTSKYMP